MREIDLGLQEHFKLQHEFDASLNRTYDPSDLLLRSYNPVTDRWNLERLRASGDLEGERALVQEIRANWEKALRERLGVAESIIRYKRVDGKLRSELFPNEPFRDVLLRGIEIRLRYGTPEPEREGSSGELGGWDEVEGMKPSEEKTIFSPHGLAQGSAYKKEFVDSYRAEADGSITLTRTKVLFDYKDFKKKALESNSSYFDKHDGRPLDAWYLSHPLDGILSNLKIDGMSNEEFMKIYMELWLQAYISNYVSLITAWTVDWKEVAKSYNAIFSRADKLKEGVIEEFYPPTPELARMRAQIEGMKNPKEVPGAGCPPSKGYDINENSVSKFSNPMSAEEAKKDPNLCRCGGKEPHFHCDGKTKEGPCGQAIIVGEGTTKCPKCGEGRKC